MARIGQKAVKPLISLRAYFAAGYLLEMIYSMKPTLLDNHGLSSAFD